MERDCVDAWSGRKRGTELREKENKPTEELLNKELIRGIKGNDSTIGV